jgi:hypothetical protein
MPSNFAKALPDTSLEQLMNEESELPELELLLLRDELPLDLERLELPFFFLFLLACFFFLSELDVPFLSFLDLLSFFACCS